MMTMTTLVTPSNPPAPLRTSTSPLSPREPLQASAIPLGAGHESGPAFTPNESGGAAPILPGGPGTPLEVGEAMLRSYSFDRKTGVSSFVIPAGVSDIEALHAARALLRATFPCVTRYTDIFNDLSWYEALPTKFPLICPVRESAAARTVTIVSNVAGTRSRDRDRQATELNRAGLELSDPRDQALAAAIHLCKHDGLDLFEGIIVRGSIPGVAFPLGEIRDTTSRFADDSGLYSVGATGSPRLPR